MPIYDKPMIYFTLTTLMLAGMKDILIVTTPQDPFALERLLGDGSRWGSESAMPSSPSPMALPKH